MHKSKTNQVTEKPPSKSASKYGEKTQGFFSPVSGGLGPFFSPNTIQPKLTIGQPGDQYEREADQMAEQVMNRLAGNNEDVSQVTGSVSPALSALGIIQHAPNNGEQLYLKKEDVLEDEEQNNADLSIQRSPISNDDEVQLKRGGAQAHVHSGLESRLSATKDGGKALPSDTRRSMETAFGVDFASVRIHVGNAAEDMCRDLGAQAFTHGSNIYFNAGKYDDASSGKALLAHELTHVVQQGQAHAKAPGVAAAPSINLSVDSPNVQLSPGDEDLSVRISVPVDREMTNTEFIIHVAQVIFDVDPEEAKTWPSQYKCTVSGTDEPCVVTKEDVRKKSKPVKVQASIFYKYFDRNAPLKEEREGPTGLGRRKGAAQRDKQFKKLPPKTRDKINKEADRRYYKRTDTPEGTKIKRGEKGKADVWKDIRDEVMMQHNFLESLDEKVKRFLVDAEHKKPLEPKDYEQLTRIAKKIMTMSDADVDAYLSGNIQVTEDLNKLEGAVDRFLKSDRRKMEGDVTYSDDTGDAGNQTSGERSRSEKGGSPGAKEGGKEGGSPGGSPEGKEGGSPEGKEGGHEEGEEGGQPEGREGGKEGGKPGGSKYGRFGLLELPAPVIKVLETAAEILGDPEALAELVDLFDELNNLQDISREIKSLLTDHETLLLVALGVIDNSAVQKLEEWALKPVKPNKKKGRKAKGGKKIIYKIKVLVSQIQKLLKPVFKARLQSQKILFKASNLLDKVPVETIEKLMAAARNKQDTALGKETEALAGNITQDIINKFIAIPQLFAKQEELGTIELIDKEDLARVVSQLVVRLAGKVGKVLRKTGLDDDIADIAKHGVKNVIPDNVVELINENLNAIFDVIKPLITTATKDLLEVMNGLDELVKKEIVPELKVLVSPQLHTKNAQAKTPNAPAFIKKAQNSPSTPLPNTVREYLRPEFGEHVDHVNIHVDKASQDATRQIDADAFTVRNDIFFAPNQFNPDTPEGLHLIAHELTHVAQHRRDGNPDIVRRVPTKSVQERLAQQIKHRVIRGTGLTKRSIVGDAFIDYGYLDEKGRPSGIIARLKSPLGKGSPAAANIKPPGFKGGAVGHARCHLLGDQLGGSGRERRNLVACLQSVNNSEIKKIENDVRRAVEQGQTVLYKVIPKYRKQGEAPYEIHYSAKGDGTPSLHIDKVVKKTS